MIIIFDIETDGLNPSVVHCIAIKIHETGEEFVFANHHNYPPLRDGIELLESADYVIGHNVLAFDIPILERLHDIQIDHHKIIDTLALARKLIKNTAMLDDSVPIELKGKQSIEAWGHRTGVLKGTFGKTTDWKTFSDEMALYSLRDAQIGTLVYELLLELI